MNMDAIRSRAEELRTELSHTFTADSVRQRQTGSCYFFIWPPDSTEDDLFDYHNCAQVRVADHPQNGRPHVGFDVDASVPLDKAIEQILAAARKQFYVPRNCYPRRQGFASPRKTRP